MDEERLIRELTREVELACQYALIAVDELEGLAGRGRSVSRLRARLLEEEHDRLESLSLAVGEEVPRDVAELSALSSLLDLQAWPPGKMLRHVRYHCASLIDHANRIDQMLWPAADNRGKPWPFPERGPALRQALGIDEDSPLRRHVRELRNSWQHLDARMEEAFAEGNVGSSWEYTSAPLTMRWGAEYVELDPVVDEIRLLLARCQLAGRLLDPRAAAEQWMRLNW